ncbi:Hypothetical protein PENO1_003970 [Penicillium occitanis (nom. inval.)]|nr:Hypothetical protein PENO1_003970 [Penicillium occitanis (nom. inval.)]PCH10339.1 hypothetical protein PENOC_001620 [Penicillium occitanis (nom. inval.)]
MDPIQLAQTKIRYKEERKKRLRSDGNAQFIQRRKGQAPETLQIRSKFVTIAAGVLNWPKLPKIPGILDYQGDMFHFALLAMAARANAQLPPTFTLGEAPAVNLVDDGWTRATALIGLTGYAEGPKSPEEIPAYTARLVEIDAPRLKRNHARVDQEVKDRAIAEKLKPW